MIFINASAMKNRKLGDKGQFTPSIIIPMRTQAIIKLNAWSRLQTVINSYVMIFCNWAVFWIEKRPFLSKKLSGLGEIMEFPVDFRRNFQ